MSCIKDDSALQFVDTNVIIYAYNSSDKGKWHQANSLLFNLWDSGRGVLSIQVLQEFYVNVTKKIENPLSPEKSSQIITDLGQWKVHIPDVSDVLAANVIQQKYKISFWDAMIICSSKSMGCSIIWTEDLNNGQYYEGVPSRNPFCKL